MIEVHVDILQNLQQAIVVFNIPSAAECNIQTDQVIVESTIVHFNDLVIDVNKSVEAVPPETNAAGQTRRTFRFPCLRMPKITNPTPHDLTDVQCAQCQIPLRIISNAQTFKIVQQQSANADDVNEVIYCHRFCEAHQHTTQPEHQPPVPLDLHSEPTILETTECFLVAKEYAPSDIVANELVQCHECSASLGSVDAEKGLLSFDKGALLPFANDYLSSCFRQQEPGRYIVKVPKVNDSLFLVWILPNQILSADASSDESTQLNFQRKRKLLFTHVTSANDKLFAEWKRDFSVTTLLVSRRCLDHLHTSFQHELKRFPNVFHPSEAFQSLTISF